jgi:hypothetical protein
MGLMFVPDGTIANILTLDEIDRVASDVLGTGPAVQEIKATRRPRISP